jgi:hypothetical protein
LQGVFIANQLSTMMDGGGMGGMGMKRTVVTRITFNGGGSWQPIKAPTTFNNQKCNRCGGATNCALHLHGEELHDFYAPADALKAGVIAFILLCVVSA